MLQLYIPEKSKSLIGFGCVPSAPKNLQTSIFVKSGRGISVILVGMNNPGKFTILDTSNLSGPSEI
jgi:hypothetical protein